jgi:hypothetical protein
MPTTTPTSSDGVARLLPRLRFIHDMPDKGLFAGVAAVGFAAIIALKVNQFSPETVSAFAVALMLIYGAVAYRFPLVRLRLDRLGDNFYYLGFIYTLASLSAALVELRSGIDSSAILGAFGIALVTTIVGIAGRVIFVQMRSEIDDVEQVIRQEILEASTHLKGQLSAALNDLDTFRTGVRQAANDSLQENTDHAKAHIAKISSVAEEAAARINDAFSARQLQGQTQLDLISRTSTAVDQLIRRIETSDALTAKAHIDQITSVAKEAAGRINEAFSARQSQLQTESELISRVSAAVEQLIRRLQSSELAVPEAHMNQIAQVAQQAAAQIEAAFTARQRPAQDLLALSARTSAAVERLMHRLESSDLPTEKLGAQLREFTATLNGFVVRLGETADAVTTRRERRTKRRWWHLAAR